VLERRQIPLAPVVLGIILGGPLDERFIQAMTASGGAITVFFARPSAAILGILALVVCFLPAVSAWRARKTIGA
jgi:TctA family transporter